MLKKLIQLNIGLYEYTKLKNFQIVYKLKMPFVKYNDVNQFIHHRKKTAGQVRKQGVILNKPQVKKGTKVSTRKT